MAGGRLGGGVELDVGGGSGGGRRPPCDIHPVTFDDGGDGGSWARDAALAADLGVIIGQGVRSVTIIADRVTELLQEVLPGVPPTVLRTIVLACMVLTLASVAQNVIGLFLWLGMLVLAAYVAVQVFGLDTRGPRRRGGLLGGAGGRPGGGWLGGCSGGRRGGRRNGSSNAVEQLEELVDNLLEAWFGRRGSRW
eukprot:scaffold14.g1024.t1